MKVYIVTNAGLLLLETFFSQTMLMIMYNIITSWWARPPAACDWDIFHYLLPTYILCILCVINVSKSDARILGL